MAGKYGGGSLALWPRQFTKRCYQLLEFKPVHDNPLLLEQNRNINTSTANFNSAQT